MHSSSTEQVEYLDPGPTGDIISEDSYQQPLLIFFVSEDWYFCSHRLPLAVAAKNSGFNVAVITRIRNHENEIRKAGIRIIPFELDRSGTNPINDIVTIAKLVKLYRREQPCIIHNVALKPVIYGSLAARFSGRPHIINALTGLGWVFTSHSIKARILRKFISKVLGNILKSTDVILQNKTDAELIANLHITRTHLIGGTGVDITNFYPAPEPEGLPLVVLPARMLWDKGIGDFVEAARILNSKHIAAKFILVGSPDPKNPSSIPEKVLSDWNKQGVVESWGYRKDMPNVFRSAHIVCLPSYREGLPKVLMEACASGLPIVTTNVPGCRDIVKPGINGLLVPARQPEALAESLEKLISDKNLRKNMGKRGYELAIKHYTQDKIISETLEVYREVLG